MAIPTYLDVLNQVKPWRATNATEELLRAEKILREGMVEYDEALPLGDELVLVLKGLGDLDGSIRLLHDLERRFKQVGEETLCRWGSVLKERATQALNAGGVGAAEMDFRESERYYGRAFEEHHTFYPRINQLSVRFVRAGLAKELGQFAASANLLSSVEADAEAMLTDATMWKLRKPDDGVWSPASRGEALVLLRRLDEAETAYAEALRAAGGQQFYHLCMLKQVRDVLVPAFRRLSIALGGFLVHPEKFFAVPGAVEVAQ